MAKQEKQVMFKSLLRERLRWRIYLIFIIAICAILVQAILPRGFITAIGSLLLVVSSSLAVGQYLICLAVAGIPWTWRQDLIMFGIAFGNALAVSLLVYTFCALPLSLSDCDTKPPVVLFSNLLLTAILFVVCYWSVMRSEWRKIRRVVEKRGDPFKTWGIR